MSDNGHLFGNENFGLLAGMAYGLGRLNAQNQANAQYNAVLQGFMNQGATPEQARLMADEYFRPQRIQAEAAVCRSRMWGWLAFGAFILFVAVALAANGDDPILAFAVVGGCGYLAWRNAQRRSRTLLALDTPSVTVSVPRLR